MFGIGEKCLNNMASNISIIYFTNRKLPFGLLVTMTPTDTKLGRHFFEMTVLKFSLNDP